MPAKIPVCAAPRLYSIRPFQGLTFQYCAPAVCAERPALNQQASSGPAMPAFQSRPRERPALEI